MTLAIILTQLKIMGLWVDRHMHCFTHLDAPLIRDPDKTTLGSYKKKDGFKFQNVINSSSYTIELEETPKKSKTHTDQITFLGSGILGNSAKN